MVLQIGDVRFLLKDLMAFHAADVGMIGQKPVEGIYINLVLKGAPTPIKAAVETEADRERVMAALEKLFRKYNRAKKTIEL